MSLYNGVLEKINLVLNFETRNAFVIRLYTGVILACLIAICSVILLFKYPTNVSISSLYLKSCFVLLLVLMLCLGAVEGLYCFLYNIVEKKYFS
jgi:uncharacterized membrane protein